MKIHYSKLPQVVDCGGKVLIPQMNWNFDKEDLNDLFKIVRDLAD